MNTEELSELLNLPLKVIENTYKAYWLFIRETASNLSFKSDLTEEEFNNLKKNFTLPSLGKLAVTFYKYKGLKKAYDNKRN